MIVYGRMKARSWEKDGQKRTSMELEVEDIGPSLKYATAKVNKVSRNGGGQRSTGGGDPWGNAASDEQPPF